MSKQNKNVESIYPLSPMQQGMLFHTLYAPNSGMYFEQLVCTLRGSLNAKSFQQAWERVVERHQVLRSLFVWEHGKQPLQIVCKSVSLPWVEYDWQEFSLVEQQERLKSLLQFEREQGFQLDQAPLMRCTLIKVKGDTYQFIWSHHHLLMDGWCLSIILKEVLTFYEASTQGENLYLAPPRPYKDYITWLQQQDLSQSEAFWRKTLQGFTTPTPLIADININNSPAEHTYAELQQLLPTTLTKSLQSLAKADHLTLNTLIQGAWALLLSRYSGEADVVFGTTVSGRPAALPGVESMVGLFINTLPVRVEVSPEAKLLPWLQQLQIQQIDLERYSYSPLVDIQTWSDVPRGTRMFESLLVFENYPLDTSLREGNGSLEVSDVRGFERTNFPLTVVVMPGAELSVQVSYDTSRFEDTTIKRMLGHFHTILAEMVEKPQANLGELQLLTKAELHQLLVEWNNTDIEYPQACLHHIFEAQVERTPDAVAVVYEDEKLTYRELNERANQVAYHLQSLGVEPEQLVGICVERSLLMAIALLGILKAGGAYVPLDPTYPLERLEYILNDAQVLVLLTQQSVLNQLPETEARLVCLDRDLPNEAVSINLISKVKPENLAYVIYTSGSTGKPKGVLVSHQNVTRLFAATQDWYNFNSSDVWTLFHSYAFDFSVWEIWGALLYGGRVVIVPYWVSRSPEAFYKLLSEERVTVLNQTPSAFYQLIHTEEAGEIVRELNLRLVIFGGEALELQSLRPWFERHGDESPQLVNMYGITETTVHVTYRPLKMADLEAKGSVIGHPIPDLQLYILDQCLQPVPIGVPGELYVSGAGVARGYLNRPELTAQRFIAKPFTNSNLNRLYKTGDLARYLPDGDIEYFGRIDHQVKIRGFRIELGEIESVLAQHPQVRQVVVIVREDEPGDKRIVAYVVTTQEDIVTSELRSFLKDRLPDYMLPSAFVLVEYLPLTSNGKVDRRALPAPDTSNSLENGYQLPRTPTEEVTAAIWAEVLGAEVSINDDFFAAGGHSLLATQVISRLQKAFVIDLPLHYLFEFPTIASLSECIDQVRQGGKNLQLPAIKPVTRKQNLPLSFAQQRLWFLDQLEGGSSAYNVPIAVHLQGSVNVSALEQSLVTIVQRHEVLRTTFPTVNGEPIQAIADSLTFNLSLGDLQYIPKTEQSVKVQELILAAAQQPFDLANEPLLRVTLLRLSAESHILLLVMHHIISDGWSMGIFIQELSALYAAFAKKEPLMLPELPVQYADFAYWQHQWLQGEVMESNLSYWKQQLANLAVVECKSDRPRPAVQTFRGTRQSLELPKDLSEDIKVLNRREGVTLFMTLIAAFNTLMHQYTGSDDIVVGTDVANRNRVETEKIIGFFVNQLVLRTDLSGDPTFRELLGRVRSVTLAAYDHQDMPFDQLVAALNPERDLSRTPLFQSKFVLQNAPMPAMEIEDLTLSILEIDDGTAKFDLLLTLWETEAGLSGNLEYSTDLFNASTITRMIEDFISILRLAVAQPNIKLQAVSEKLIAAQEQEKIDKEKDFQQSHRRKFTSWKSQSTNVTKIEV